MPKPADMRGRRSGDAPTADSREKEHQGQEEGRLIPLLERFRGEEFILTVPFGKGEDADGG